MSDIVERARKYSPYDYEPGSQVYREANLRAALIAEIERLRTEIELLHAELRVTKKLGLAALQDAMRQARTGEER